MICMNISTCSNSYMCTVIKTSSIYNYYRPNKAILVVGGTFNSSMYLLIITVHYEIAFY